VATRVKRIVLIVTALIVAAAAGSWWWARGSLPPLDGERRVSGLRAPVEILMDGHGVPHVYAAGPEDAWFAAGLLHARDRLWQMELYRRAADGRLSEIFGPETLPIDRRFLTLGLRAAAEAEWQSTAPEVRDALTRYADGVNAQIADAAGRRRPLEFQILRITPAQWTPVDSLAVGRLLSWRLAENHQAELVRHALSARFGASEALLLGGRYPDGAPTVIQGASPGTGAGGALGALGTPGAGAPSALAATRATSAPAHPSNAPVASDAPIAPAVRQVSLPPGLEWLHPTAHRGNSNNWVIAGRRTASGRPLLANDPHLQLEFPGVWYEMHLVAAGLDVVGVSIPGAPFVIIGHNNRVAWGLTNTGADVQDLYVERIDIARRRYLSGGQWVPVDVTTTSIPVRGEESRPFEVWRTRHGTVFADVGVDWLDAPPWLSPDSERSGERRAFVLRWEGLVGETAGAFESLNRATDWPSFTAAVQRFSAPSQNFVYADVDGNIGYAMSGALPLRASGVGMLPNDGSSGEGEWSARIASSSLPRLFNPDRGFITSSNNQIDRQWSGLITRDWAAPYRTTRLHELIDAGSAVNLVTAAGWQNDVAGLGPTDVLAGVEAALTAAKQRSADAAALDVLSQLRAWDKRVDDRPVVTLYHLFEDQLWRRTFFDEMGDPLFSRFYEWAGAERPAGLYAILDDPASRWFDDIATLGHYESRDDIFLLAALDAHRRFTTEFGSGSWAAVHAAAFAHPLGRVWPMGWLFNRGPSPLVGDITTVNRVSYNRLQPFAAWEVPSWRQLFDVGAWDESRVVLPGGQSGHPMSPHYFDQNEMWRQGQYRAQPFSRTAVDAAQRHRQILTP
jgi:penicillin amidase